MKHRKDKVHMNFTSKQIEMGKDSNRECRRDQTENNRKNAHHTDENLKDNP